MDHDETPEGEFCPGCGRIHTPEELEQMRIAKLARNFVETMIVPGVDGFEQRIGGNVGSVWFHVFQESIYQLARYGDCPPKVMRDAMRDVLKQAVADRHDDESSDRAMAARATAPGSEIVQ